MIDINTPKGAVFSNDRKYRYALWRIWNPNKELLLTIGLNPSSANESKDDPTITRLNQRPRRENAEVGCRLNVYAWHYPLSLSLLLIKYTPSITRKTPFVKSLCKARHESGLHNNYSAKQMRVGGCFLARIADNTLEYPPIGLA